VKTSTTSRSSGHIRSALLVLITSFLLITGQSQAVGQADPQSMASGYFDWLLGRSNGFATATLMSPNGVLHTPEGVFRGQDGAEAFGSNLRGSFSDLAFEVQSTDVVGGTMVIEFTMSGVHTGAYQGMDWDCARVSVPGVAVLRTGDDGFSEQWITYDQQTLLDQIYVHGLVPWSERASCDSYLRIDAPFAEPVNVPEGPPTCLPRAICSTPY
jgi:hypothetical protein